MKQFNFEKKRSEGFQALEAGGYVCQVLNAEILTYDWGEVLKIDFDIANGEFKDYFRNKYKNNTNEDKKWQGTVRVNVPDEGNQWYESQKKKFGNMIACFEESNNGWEWNWDEASLKNLFVGIVFGNEEYDFNGHQGWTAKPKLFVSTDDILNNNFKIPKDKPLENKSTFAAMDFEIINGKDEDLPWN